eukprot:GHVO01016491.1.p2 GENE.GHVO01016491.1~~GHVO01016491.1.p2  ORF type:complete len:126 (-),score=24.28 GHVO01016491.1:23-400(-)
MKFEACIATPHHVIYVNFRFIRAIWAKDILPVCTLDKHRPPSMSQFLTYPLRDWDMQFLSPRIFAQNIALGSPSSSNVHSGIRDFMFHCCTLPSEVPDMMRSPPVNATQYTAFPPPESLNENNGF